jgi:hypothetical protein
MRTSRRHGRKACLIYWRCRVAQSVVLEYEADGTTKVFLSTPSFASKDRCAGQSYTSNTNRWANLQRGGLTAIGSTVTLRQRI